MLLCVRVLLCSYGSFKISLQLPDYVQLRKNARHAETHMAIAAVTQAWFEYVFSEMAGLA